MKRAVRAVASAFTDLAGLAGAALIAYGAAQIYYPAGLIVGGVLLLGGVLAISLARGTPPSQ